MNLALDKVLSRGSRPGYGAIWQFRDLPELQLAQGLRGGQEWSIVRSGDGFFFIHNQKPLSILGASVLGHVGDRAYPVKRDALEAVTKALNKNG